MPKTYIFCEHRSVDTIYVVDRREPYGRETRQCLVDPIDPVPSQAKRQVINAFDELNRKPCLECTVGDGLAEEQKIRKCSRGKVRVSEDRTLPPNANY